MDGEGWSGVVMDCGNDSTYKIVIYVMILEYVHISYQNFACLMTCLGISLRGCNCLCGKNPYLWYDVTI